MTIALVLALLIGAPQAAAQTRPTRQATIETLESADIDTSGVSAS